MAKIGPLITADQAKSRILASVSTAQFIRESGYGKTELAQNANNCFGMKASLSGNTWEGSCWDGKSIYTKETTEELPDGTIIPVIADFRKYPCIEDSIADHSAYLLGAMNGNKKRYEGLAGETDYRKAAQIIKNGGYATDSQYVDALCEIITRWNLTQFDLPTGEADYVVSRASVRNYGNSTYQQNTLWKSGRREIEGYVYFASDITKVSGNIYFSEYEKLITYYGGNFNTVTNFQVTYSDVSGTNAWAWPGNVSGANINRIYLARGNTRTGTYGYIYFRVVGT